MTAAAAIVATACGTTVDGTPTSTTGAPAPGTAATARLDTGNYPTKPRPPLGAASTPVVGSRLDAQRMAGYVLGPWEVDPRLDEPYSPGPLVLKSADAINMIEDKTVADAAGKHQFVNGFFSARQAGGQTILRNVVLRFADPESASAAATDMRQAALDLPASGAARSPVPIPGHPEALTSNYPFTPSATHDEWAANLTSFTPHGPYVLMQLAESHESLDEGTALIAKTLDLQIPLIDQFQPTAPADFPGLPLDPSGLLARTLPVPHGQGTVVNNATFDRRGAEHFMLNPVTDAKLFDDTGMEVLAKGAVNVYQTADAVGAAKVAQEFVTEVGVLDSKPAAPVSGVPASTCLTLTTGPYCLASVDRYVIEVQAEQMAQVRQQMAAQYLMLTAK
jgi:hypothetical protein